MFTESFLNKHDDNSTGFESLQDKTGLETTDGEGNQIDSPLG